jgi:hypothetical protein
MPYSRRKWSSVRSSAANALAVGGRASKLPIKLMPMLSTLKF